MSTIESILKCMSSDKNIKTISIEFKRMSGGIKMTYETRIGDATKMGVEFVNDKDFTNGALVDSQEKVMSDIYQSCHKNHEDNHD